MSHFWTTQKRRARVWWDRANTAVRPSRIQLYLLKAFFSVLFLCLLASISLFIVFELFDRMNVFIKEEATLAQITSYLLYKIPVIGQLMMPIAVLVATLLSTGRLSQLSEITAMRACGPSLFFLARPLLVSGLLISFGDFVLGETIVPVASQRVEEIYHFDIKKKAERGAFSRANFWYRKRNKFYNIGLYDSQTETLKGVSVFELNRNFKLERRTDAREAVWGGSPSIGWTMADAVEISIGSKGDYNTSTFPKAPLIIDEVPTDFYNMERRAETMSYSELKKYTAKLREEGVAATNYLVDLAAKLSFPLVNFIVILVAFPLALTPARSGSLSISIVSGVCIGFGYYVIHALSLSLGNAELLPIHLAAWTANVLVGGFGAYLMASAEYKY